ncbi:23S rRNA (uracil(1939)-C(5))-methyltransferase RlmD [Thiobacter aerophilum]|uniref:23S rRNA (uracil(1939)-C(5))-methyltransferase RlmD n=1 Tax=Thiobacter aerophilum TaxID=3121275 RepID=A0ABV0EGX7_9BURK
MSARIESLDHEGRGVAHVAGKVVFVEGALPGECVEYRTLRRKSTYELGEVTRVLEASFMRVTPRCPYFGVCGGCLLQHMEPYAQVAAKQRILEDNLARIGKVRPESMLPAIHGPSWGYRHRARMSARLVAKKGGVLVGFHERRSSFIADMHGCEILPPRIARLIDPLRALIGGLSVRERAPQVEIALGERVDALVLRILEPLSADDEVRLREFADAHGIQWWLQPKGPDSVFPFYPLEAPHLSYTLPEFGLDMPFSPTEFTQVNPAINRVLVRRAMALLDPQPGERIADLFCGLGNFSLPMARRGATVVGVEGSSALVARARANAAHNGLAASTHFLAANLFEVTPETLAEWGHFDKMLIDPPRDGAIQVVKALGSDAPARIVYVSCSPATLARDAAVLSHEKGYHLLAAGVVNMFPHTGHVESIALFER